MCADKTVTPPCAKSLARTILKSGAEDRLRLQPSFEIALRDMRRDGVQIPADLRDLSDRLLDEAIEARFDNLPI